MVLSLLAAFFGSSIICCCGDDAIEGNGPSSGGENADPQPVAVQTVMVNGTSFQMILVEGGTFTMGSGIKNETLHEVKLSSFYIGQTEVTQELWQAVTGSNPSELKGNKRPVETVSWNDCQTFITKLNALTGKKFRLPTEAEWEYAARGGKLSKGYTYSGSNNLDEVAWSGVLASDDPNYGTHDVGTKAPNELGIYDMTGNVYEWCQDWWGSYGKDSQINPTGPTSGTWRVARGGGWGGQAGPARVSARANWLPTDATGNIGFRLAL